MNIVVLDGYTLNPGDLSWQGLEALGNCTVYDRTPAPDIVSRAAPADIVLTNKTPLTRETLALLPSLRYIGVLATGYNIVDVAAARERGIAVTNVPSYGTMSVAQVVFAHLLNLTHGIAHHTDAVRQGRWSSSADFSFWDTPLLELGGKTMGIVGLGQIGRAVARIARAFGMDAIAYDRSPAAPVPADVHLVPLDDVFSRSDVVTLHCPLTAETTRLVNRTRLAMMKPTAFLINTSRGPVIDETALGEALENGTIAGAGLDVLSSEPPPPDHPLLHARNCFITPHFAWASTAARRRLMEEVIQNVRAFHAGQARNIVNG
ncbi:MAG: glycerate dehydrogenase [Bacteroidetes bacterium]|jgi:glycerate dehydrogenase|nr:glycerate dehydrogenase [Bacteroidota bacterium]